ncbi:diguanylate cyclase [Duganella sp. HH105]|uniref:diguanylate cyclase n=1 Tax=Duganella sp. HH105 TaxID=1781067 RepID=UPI000877AFF5|nr:diguanylate cyclase [Duganella sp. HH105]OEZ55442.1 response regulator PleD [Duganella sp. HH105]
MPSAAVAAERVRQIVERQTVEAGLPDCTTSIGCACIDGSGPTVEALLADADAALYTAKHEGRNAVRLAQPQAKRASASARR